MRPTRMNFCFLLVVLFLPVVHGCSNCRLQRSKVPPIHAAYFEPTATIFVAIETNIVLWFLRVFSFPHSLENVDCTPLFDGRYVGIHKFWQSPTRKLFSTRTTTRVSRGHSSEEASKGWLVGFIIGSGEETPPSIIHHARTLTTTTNPFYFCFI